MPPAEIQAVIFDLDGVIADTVKLHYEAWKLLTDEYDIPFSHAINEQLRGLSRRDSLDILWKGRTLSEQDAEMLMRKKNEHYLELVGKMTPDDVLPGVVDVIEEARKRGMKVAIASSSQNAKPVLEQLQLTNRFDVIGDALDVVNTKPAPDIFLWVAGRINVHPSTALIIEDSPAGISAALQAGFYVVGVGKGQTEEAHMRLEHLSDVSAEKLFDHFSSIAVE